MSDKKTRLLANFGFVILDQSAKRSFFVKSEEDIQRMLSNGEIGDGDVIVKLTKENIRVAEKKNYIEIL